MKIIQRTFTTKSIDSPLPIQIEKPTNEDRVIRFVASDDTIDRYNEVILAEAWDLDNYLRNPVVMQFHDYSVWPIGKAVAIGVVNGQLLIDSEFDPPEIDAEADKVFKKIKHGSVRMGSVGFLPVEYLEPDKQNKALFDHYPTASRIYTKAELIEWTICPIGANPMALAAALKHDMDKRFIGSQSNPAVTPDEPTETARKIEEIVNRLNKTGD